MTEHLAALSDAATQGEWRIHGAMLGYRGDIFSPTAKQVKDCHHIARFYADKPDKTPVCDLQAIGAARDAIQQIEANTSFVVALVNAYRANQIAVIGPDAVERVGTDFEQEGMVIWTKAEMAHSDAMKKLRTLPNKAAATVIAKALRSAALTGRV
jgi:hypothetical protein